MFRLGAVERRANDPTTLPLKKFLVTIRCLVPLVFAAIAGVHGSAIAQDIEPRANSNAPIGYNFVVAGHGYTRSGLAFNESLPLVNPELPTSNAIVGYARVIELLGQSAKIDAILPYTALSGTADYRGQQVEREIHGFGNPAFRLSANLFGATALSPKEFAAWQQDIILGASLRVSPPWSQ